MADDHFDVFEDDSVRLIKRARLRGMTLTATPAFDEVSSDKPEPIDPKDVQVGDVVEIEADDKSWMVRGEVLDTDRERLDVHIAGRGRVLRPPFTVRLVSRPEPEPDPEQVRALGTLLAGVVDGRVEEAARYLIERGVRVDGDAS